MKFKVGDVIRHKNEVEGWAWRIILMTDRHYIYECVSVGPDATSAYQGYRNRSELTRLRFFNLVKPAYIKSNKPNWF